MREKQVLVLTVSALILASAVGAALFSNQYLMSPAVVVNGGGGISTTVSAQKTLAYVGQSVSGTVRTSSHYRLEVGAIYVADALDGVCRYEVSGSQDTLLTLDPSCGPGTIFVRSGSYGDKIIVTANIPLSFPPMNSSIKQLNPTQVGMAISVSDKNEPRDPVTFVFRYTDENVSGMDQRRLRLAYYSESGNQWVPLDSTVDLAAKTVQAQTKNFQTLLLVEQAPSPVVTDGLISPNPFRPSLGHTVMRFSSLPAEVEVMIFTLTGQMVRRGKTDAAGQMFWDVTNENGEKVVSGIYLAFVQQGSNRKIYKLAVQR